jgi:diguanylate cyclase (GGDEF)-like protein/PAS domain S-box-containing protein
VQLPLNRTITSPTLQALAMPRPGKPVRSPYEHLLSEVFKLRFGDRTSTCLLVDDSHQVIHIFLNTARLLDFPLGAINTNVLDLVSPSLKVPLSTALHRARRDQQSVLYSDIRVAKLAADQRIKLWVGSVDPKATDADTGSQLIILLEVFTLADTVRPSADTAFDPNADLPKHMRELEYELQQTRENLQTSIEELETANEEQQATNEELLASNEELQSTNEELQSVNEELYTVNAEKQERIQQLTELTADIDNLLQSTDIGVVFFDETLNIRKFTPAATDVFNFRMGDTGRPLSELVNYLDIDNLMALLEQVVATQTPQKTEAINRNTGDRLLLRILPYRREDGTIDGVVLTLIKVNDLNQVQYELLQANQLLESLYRNSLFGLGLLDQDLRFLRLNQTLADMNGYSIETHLGQALPELLPELYNTLQPYLQQVLETQSPVTYEVSGTTAAHPDDERTWLAAYYPVMFSDKQQGIGAIVTDITAQKQIQADLKSSRALIEQIAETSPAILALFELPSGKVVYINSAIEVLLGYTPAEIYEDGEEILARHVHPDDVPIIQEHFAALSQAQVGDILAYEYRARHKDGSWHWIYQRNTVFRRDDADTTQTILGVGTDITERVQTQSALQRNESLLRTTLASTTTIVLFTQDLDLRYTWIHNPVPGFRMADMIGHHDRDFLTAAEAEELTRLKQGVLDTGEVCTTSFTLRSSSAPLRLYELTLAPQYNVKGELIGLTGVGIDITRTKQLQQLTQRLEQAQQMAHIGNWDYDIDQDTLTWSAEVFRMTGWDPEQGEPSIAELLSMLHPEDRTSVTNLIDRDQDLPETIHLDLRIRPRNSEEQRYISITGRHDQSPSGQLTRLYGTVMDVTARKKVEAELEHRAFFDALTQFPNRAFFLQHLQLSMARVSRDSSNQFAVLYLDLDNFKEVNDTLGHSVGDQLLIKTAQRLDDILRPGDIVSRLGGDEFAILLEKTAHPELALQVAYRIHTTIAQPITISSHQISSSSSIGIAFYQLDDPWNSDTAVLENADIAMYQAKRKGPGSVELFHPDMRAQRLDQVELKVAVAHALEQNEFLLYYQPLLDLQRKTLIGFEALVRWQHPQRGLLSPLAFLPVVQASRLMPGLESWILKRACAQCSRWQHQFALDPAFRLNINVSADFLKHSSFMDNLRMALADSGVDPQHLCLEITENSFIGRNTIIDTILPGIKNLGIQIALDDFGTGYSSLSYTN